MPEELGGATRMKRGWYAQGAEGLARMLLGKWLVRIEAGGRLVAGRIVETEAYLGVHDGASHARGGRRSARNEVMYAPPGHAYVYFTYGMHHCFNVVCGEEGEPAAVLVRALEPVLGVESMGRLRRRGMAKRGKRGKAGRIVGGRVLRDRDLCSGPGKLCEAMGIDLRLNGADMVRENRVCIAEPPGSVAPLEDTEVVRTSRIGVGYAGAWAGSPLRFYVASSPHVSVR